MNYLESIYCSQYYEHSKSGHSLDKARRNAGIFTSLMIFMLLVAACLLADMFTPHHPISRFFSRGVGYHALGRMAGKLLGATVVLGIVGIINLTYGSKANYERMMARWQQLPEDELKATVNKAIKAWFISGGAFVAALILWAL